MGITTVEVVTAGLRGAPGIAGASTEVGGVSNQVLMKQSNVDFDTAWSYVNALNVEFTSRSTLTSLNVEEALDELNTAASTDRTNITNNTTAAATAQTQADLGVTTANAADTLAKANEVRIVLAESNISENDTDITQLKAAVEYTDSKLSINVDNISDVGIYLVDTNLPGGATDGVLTIRQQHPSEGTSKVQQLAAGNKKEYTRKSSDGTTWGTWTEADNSIRISALEAKVPFAAIFEISSATGVVVPGDTYSEIAKLVTTDLPAGTYKLDKDLIYSLNSTTASAFFRFSTDNGTTWTEIRKEPIDNTGLVALAHPSVFIHSGGIMNIIIESRKETAGDSLVINTVDIVLERKL